MKNAKSQMKKLVETYMTDYQNDYYNYDLPMLERRAEDIRSHKAIWILRKMGTDLLPPYVPGESFRFLGADHSVEKTISGTLAYYKGERYFLISTDGIEEITHQEAIAYLPHLAMRRRRYQVRGENGRYIYRTILGERTPCYFEHGNDEGRYYGVYRVAGSIGTTIEEAYANARRMAEDTARWAS